MKEKLWKLTKLHKQTKLRLVNTPFITNYFKCESNKN